MFSFPVEAEHASKLVKQACEDAGALHYSISDSLKHQVMPVKIPYKLDESMLDLDRLGAHPAQL